VSRLVVSEFVTVDGVMEDPGGSEGFERGGWAFRFERGADGDKFKLDEVMGADAQLLGRKTYEGFAAAWPGRDDEAGFAAKMNTMPKYVVSSTLSSPEWQNTTVIDGDIVEEIKALKQRVDGDILVYGSARLVRTMIDHGLVDELRLMVFPVVLGRGERLFADDAQQSAFELVETKQTGAVAILTLRPTTADA